LNLDPTKTKTFSDICTGDRAEFDVLISDEMLSDFANLFKDYSPVHTDEKFCKTTRFGRKIGYAFMLTGFLSQFYGEHLPGGSSVCIKQDANFIKPFFAGDQLRISGEVTGKIESTKFVEIKTEIFSNNNCIFRGLGTVHFFEQQIYQPLFEANDKKIGFPEIIESLAEVGIRKGDSIFVHSDISVFGKLQQTDRNILLDNLLSAIKESVGSAGTVIMPAFTYSFCKGRDFDPVHSESVVGVLSEHFRKQPEISRTNHPIFSVAVWGGKKEQYLDVDKDSFGEQSIFGRLRQNNAKLLLFGAPFNSMTFMHHIEQSHGVPYRYLKKFKGVIKTGSNEYEDESTYYVRNLEMDSDLETSKFEKHLLNKRLLKCTELGSGRILMGEAKNIFGEGVEMLDQDINFFIESPQQV
jgi:aminoglycoside 3-N-acetyltransferase